MEEVTSDVVEIAREQELGIEPEDVIEWLSSYDKTLMNKELLLMDEQRKWSGEDTVKTAEMTTKDLEYYTYLVGLPL